jgi:hypothetical protein
MRETASPQSAAIRLGQKAPATEELRERTDGMSGSAPVGTLEALQSYLERACAAKSASSPRAQARRPQCKILGADLKSM